MAGLLLAVVAWFAIVYPNISALPLPSAVANAYQGLLPTYLYAFQFPVSTGDRNVATPLLSPTLAILTVGHRADLPGRRLLGLGVAAGAGRVGDGGAGLRRRPTARRRSADGLARTGGGA